MKNLIPKDIITYLQDSKDSELQGSERTVYKSPYDDIHVNIYEFESPYKDAKRSVSFYTSPYESARLVGSTYSGFVKSLENTPSIDYTPLKIRKKIRERKKLKKGISAIKIIRKEQKIKRLIQKIAEKNKINNKTLANQLIKFGNDLTKDKGFFAKLVSLPNPTEILKDSLKRYEYDYTHTKARDISDYITLRMERTRQNLTVDQQKKYELAIDEASYEFEVNKLVLDAENSLAIVELSTDPEDVKTANRNRIQDNLNTAILSTEDIRKKKESAFYTNYPDFEEIQIEPFDVNEFKTTMADKSKKLNEFLSSTTYT
jgi:hypothetical protein